MKVIIHAPTADALARARADARNLLNSPAEGTVRIVVSGDAVPALLDGPDPTTDRLAVLCADTLARLGRSAPSWMETTPHAGYLVSRLQKKGWSYLRS